MKYLLFLAIFTLISTPLVFAQEYEYAIPGIEFLDPVHAALNKIATSTADNFIQIVGALIILLIGYVSGRIVETALKKILAKVIKAGHDHPLFGKDILGDDKNIGHITNLIPFSLKWFVYLIFIIASVNALGLIELSDALADLWLWIPNIIASIVLLILGTIVIKLISKWLLDAEVFTDDDTTGKLIKGVIKVVIYSIVIAIAMIQLGVGEEIITVLVNAFAWGIAGAFAIGVGLGLWKVIPIWVSGKDNEKLGIKKGAKIGINTDDYEVIEVGLTKIKVKVGDKVKLIPHSFFDDKIISLE